MNPHFASLVLGLAQQAEAALQGQLPPGAEARGDARAVAQTLIDTLGMLQTRPPAGWNPTRASCSIRPSPRSASASCRRGALLMRRAAIIVLDGLGIGPAPDTDRYGDSGSDTLGNVARAVGGLHLPHSRRSAWALRPLPACRRPRPPAAPGIAQPRSAGKDSTTGHWELCGVVLDAPFPTYPDGFPAELIDGVRPAHRARRAGQPGRLRHRDPGRARRRAPAHRALDPLHLGRQRLSGRGA